MLKYFWYDSAVKRRIVLIAFKYVRNEQHWYWIMTIFAGNTFELVLVSDEWLDCPGIFSCNYDLEVIVLLSLFMNRLVLAAFYSEPAGVWLWFGAGGHLDLAPGQSLCKALKILKLYNWRDAEISGAKPSSQPVNLPGARPLMKPLNQSIGDCDHMRFCAYRRKSFLIGWRFILLFFIG